MNFYYKLKRKLATIILRKNVDLTIPSAVISFSFDDIPDSAITNGARILKKYGFKGTYYICMGLKKPADSAKTYFDHSQLKQLVDDGNELACHTYNHIKLYTSSKKQIIEDLNKNQVELNKLIPDYKFTSFSYPYGQQTFASKRITQQRYASSRGVISGMQSKNADINNLKAIELQDDYLPLQQALSLVDQAINSNAWLIFYTHDVESKFTKFGCSPSYFEEVVKYCHDKKVAVHPINEVISKFCKQG